MKRGTSILAIGILLGVSLTLNAGNRSAHEGQAGVAEQMDTTQQTLGSVKLSDEERADIFMARKSYDEAIDYYSRAIKSLEGSQQNKPQIAALWNKMGICYQQKMDYRQARDAYKRATRLNHLFAQPWNNIGTTFYLSHKAKKSIGYYRHAIKLGPNAAAFHLNLGMAYFARKKYEEASREYRTAILLDPDILKQRSNEGSAIETRHVNAKFYFYMAKVFASVGNTTEAVRYLEHAMEEGFNDRNRILKDPDFQKISKDPAFIALIKNPPVPIKE
ncbi:MAG TPA: tetratricopeptide repeat protein [Terriglobia bacterium]|jgi:tetratricopeptide (TPR) repeat protein|nr:tetratricopeptide repeat protein [Terriglobia bacterium]